MTDAAPKSAAGSHLDISDYINKISRKISALELAVAGALFNNNGFGPEDKIEPIETLALDIRDELAVLDKMIATRERLIEEGNARRAALGGN